MTCLDPHWSFDFSAIKFEPDDIFRFQMKTVCH